MLSATLRGALSGCWFAKRIACAAVGLSKTLNGGVNEHIHSLSAETTAESRFHVADSGEKRRTRTRPSRSSRVAARERSDAAARRSSAGA